MNNKVTTFIKNFSYSLSSNLISMIIASIVILVVPKLMDVNDYGFWQLYLFYSSYVGFLHLGWNDGIYLRYGGKEYKELNKELFFSQFWMLTIFQIVLGTVIIGLSIFFSTSANRVFIFNMIALCMLFVNIRLALIYILQCTNRIKEFAQITMMEKILYCILILLLLLVGFREYQLLIFADIIGKFISLLYAIYCCRDIVFNKLSAFHLNFWETYKNISVGIKLMFANVASMLIIGIVRFGIERTWDVSTFGKVSLTLSISNLMMVFINAVGIILFPVLRRTNRDKLPWIYTTMDTLLMVLLFGLLLVYYPLKVILTAWLPEYGDSLMYMALIFPISVFEGKMALLIGTYFKTMRREKLMLIINLLTVLLSITTTLIFTVVYKDLSLTIVSIVILLAFRCILSEIFLSKILNVSVYKEIISEIIMSIVFIVTGWFVNSLIGFIIYLATYIIYLHIKKHEITLSLKNVKQLVKG